MNALNILCVQLTRDLFAIAKFLFHIKRCGNILTESHTTQASNAGVTRQKL